MLLLLLVEKRELVLEEDLWKMLCLLVDGGRFRGCTTTAEFVDMVLNLLVDLVVEDDASIMLEDSLHTC